MIDLDAPTPLEKFAVPHQFQPQMTLRAAFLAVMSALAQILAGCLIGALWGVRIWIAVASTHSTPWKVFAVFGLVSGLALSMGLMLWSVRAVAARLSKKPA